MGSGPPPFIRTAQPSRALWSCSCAEETLGGKGLGLENMQLRSTAAKGATFRLWCIAGRSSICSSLRAVVVWSRPALAGAYCLELAAGQGCTSDYILCRRASYTGIDLADAEQPVKERKPKSKAAKAPLTAEEAEEVARMKRVAEAQAYNKETREEMRRAVRASGAPRSKTKLFGRRHVSKLSFPRTDWSESSIQISYQGTCRHFKR